MITDILAEFGNGDPLKGEYLLKRIAATIKKARTKHSIAEWQNMGITKAYEALSSETDEVLFAMARESDERINEELRDVITVAVRMLNKEYYREK